MCYFIMYFSVINISKIKISLFRCIRRNSTSTPNNHYVKSKIVVRVYQYHWAVSHSSILHFVQPNTINATAKKKLRPGPALFQGEIITKKRKYIDDIKGHFYQTWQKVSLGKGDSNEEQFYFQKDNDVFIFSYSMLWYSNMCYLIWTGFLRWSMWHMGLLLL